MRANAKMALAVTAATKSIFLSNPNPRVGCAIFSGDGLLLGVGNTQHRGGHHAEIMALHEASLRGQSLRAAVAFVTLEPCSHHGHTPPCCEALIAAGIKRVVVANLDPNPLVAGRGATRLRAAGIEVEVLPRDNPQAIASRELNIGFFSRMERKTPWVRMKIAASLDGQTALPNGQSQWITSEAARTDGHAWRARACAVLTGIGTVLKDQPRLDVRLVATPRQPHLVVIDSRLETPLDAPLFIAGRTVFIYAAVPNSLKKQALEAHGATVVYLPGASGKVDLKAMLLDLACRDINELHVEAGHKLNGSLVRAGLVDEFVVYLAPKLLGQGSGMADFGPLAELSEAVELEFMSTESIGPDLRIVARVKGRDQF
jgi:diaminohydroxyphosphoribosylaminopyrimidine deaminase/5-amino-6-(5-phosphoribosylamino)uracil reductase